ncbi:MAG: hypothetical protein ACRDZN_09445 [Acidimicrobiales bacterium]
MPTGAGGGGGRCRPARRRRASTASPGSTRGRWTATRLAEDRYLLVTGTAFGNHDLAWIHKQQAALPEGDE